MSCRTCKYLDVAPDKLGRIVPRKDKTYRCLAPDPEMPTMPDSITETYGFRWFEGQRSRTYMTPDAGENCPCHEPRETQPIS